LNPTESRIIVSAHAAAGDFNKSKVTVTWYLPEVVLIAEKTISILTAVAV
jgi:hypothetical protein